MDEISVIVNQDPGRISWNFEEVKAFLAAEMDKYTGLVYTDETIKTAKADVASLRALAKQIEDRRKEVKAKCLEPYAVIEEQAKVLTGLIDGPINQINQQVQDYEERRKKKVKAEIAEYWQEKIVDVPERIRTDLSQKLYDPRWLNATTAKKTWKEAIDRGIADTLGDLDTIRSFHSEFEDDMLSAYYKTLSLQESIRTMNDLRAQQERVLEVERRKKEQEEAERLRRESEAAEAARRREEQPQQATVTENPNDLRRAPERPVPPAHPVQKEEPNSKVLRIFGDEAQIQKVIGYIRFCGLDFVEVKP